MIDQAVLAEAGRTLRANGFCEEIQSRRAAVGSEFEPWLTQDAVAGPFSSHVNLLHFLRGQHVVAFRSEMTELLLRSGLAAPNGSEHLMPDRWQVTAYRGLLAVRDLGSKVYIGEDSLRFVDAILGSSPQGHALDLGCGSGISSSALSRTCDRVVAVDVDPEAVEASTVTAALNGCVEQISVVHGDIRDLDLKGRFDCVAANLPGVPVPSGIVYSSAGDGGDDGLRTIRAGIHKALELLEPSEGVLVMRLQSLGSRNEPLLLSDLRRLSSAVPFDAFLLIDGCMPVEVRAAITAQWATPLNPLLKRDELLELVDSNHRRLGADSYFSCTLVLRMGGSGTVQSIAGFPQAVGLYQPVRLMSDDSSPRFAIAAHRVVLERLRHLPDGLLELLPDEYRRLFSARFLEFLEVLRGRASVDGLVRNVFGDALQQDPVVGRSLLSLCLDAVQALCASGHVGIVGSELSCNAAE